MRRFQAATLLSMCVSAAPAAAVEYKLQGIGKVTQVVGQLSPTGVAPIGSALSFSFGFDTAAASLYEQADGYAVYDLPVTDFEANLGGYRFSLNADPAFVPALEISRGFSFFGGSSSEPSLGITFYFAGAVRQAGDDPAPFVLSPGSRDALAFTALFKADPDDTAVGLDQIMVPLAAGQQSFFYSVRDAVTNRPGQLKGTLDASLTTAAPVPEPETWAIMVAGLAATWMIGARRRKAFQTGSGPA